jgi:hypothetical protein
MLAILRHAVPAVRQAYELRIERQGRLRAFRDQGRIDFFAFRRKTI